jgi:uncharacterized phage protein (TIGR02220 family)
MATDKKSFVLYADLIHTIEKMPNDKAGELFKHILMYVNDRKPITEDLLIQLTFEPIKQQFKRDLVKWEKTIEGRSAAGKASAEARRLTKEQSSTNLTSVDFVQQSSTNPTVSDNVNVNVNDIKVNNNLSVDYVALLKFFNDVTSRNFRVVSGRAKNQIKDRIKEGYTKQDFANAIQNCFNDEYHQNHRHYLTLEFISRSDKMEKYATDALKPKPTKK